LNPPPVPSPSTEPLLEDAAGGSALAAWHAGWATAVGLTALGGVWMGSGSQTLVVPAALAMATPGLLGLTLMGRDGSALRAALLAAWSLAAIAAAGLSGGLTGPLGGFVFMPLAAAIALGSARLAPFGALGTALAVLAGLIAAALNGGPDASPGRPRGLRPWPFV
jgi:cell cycle sensor histidine kinase DivJ